MKISEARALVDRAKQAALDAQSRSGAGTVWADEHKRIADALSHALDVVEAVQAYDLADLDSDEEASAADLAMERSRYFEEDAMEPEVLIVDPDAANHADGIDHVQTEED